MSETRATLEERLEAAEQLCWLFGWTAAWADGPREKAAAVAWRLWYATQTKADEKAAIKAWPDARIELMAAEYDTNRAAVMANLNKMIEVEPS